MIGNNFKIEEVECPERLSGVEGENIFFVYILLCSDGSFYCGSTKELNNRIKEHNSGEASVWTKKRKPVKLVYYEIQESLRSARRRERQIKGWRVDKKINLIKGFFKK